jgi:signal transduction histidine kinase
MIAEADYILGRERKPEEYIKHISGMVEDLRKLNALLNSLLELADLNRDNKISLSPVRVDELIFNSIQAIKIKYPRRKILPKIGYSENENDLLISGNAGFLEIALKNLIDNACKFSSEEVEVKALINEKTINIHVVDHGIGIPSNELENIFKPFKRGPNVKYIGGFGIGLSIVAKIIALHNAEIKVTSVENEGTSFELSFKKNTD